VSGISSTLDLLQLSLDWRCLSNSGKLSTCVDLRELSLSLFSPFFALLRIVNLLVLLSLSWWLRPLVICAYQERTDRNYAQLSGVRDEVDELLERMEAHYHRTAVVDPLSSSSARSLSSG
jgi:hypothetical protein